MFADIAREGATRYVVNGSFTQAALFFRDGSFVRFEHSSRQNRWARASADDTMAERICAALHQFRLNAKHLQLYFDDGSDAEFVESNPTLEKGGKADDPT